MFHYIAHTHSKLNSRQGERKMAFNKQTKIACHITRSDFKATMHSVDDGEFISADYCNTVYSNIPRSNSYKNLNNVNVNTHNTIGLVLNYLLAYAKFWYNTIVSIFKVEVLRKPGGIGGCM
jgi:hypothetical protein